MKERGHRQGHVLGSDWPRRIPQSTSCPLIDRFERSDSSTPVSKHKSPWQVCPDRLPWGDCERWRLRSQVSHTNRFVGSPWSGTSQGPKGQSPLPKRTSPAAWREKTQRCLANPQCTNWRAVSFTDHRSPITDYWFARAAPTLAKS